MARNANALNRYRREQVFLLTKIRAVQPFVQRGIFSESRSPEKLSEGAKIIEGKISEIECVVAEGYAGNVCGGDGVGVAKLDFAP